MFGTHIVLEIALWIVVRASLSFQRGSQIPSRFGDDELLGCQIWRCQVVKSAFEKNLTAPNLKRAKIGLALMENKLE